MKMFLFKKIRLATYLLVLVLATGAVAQGQSQPPSRAPTNGNNYPLVQGNNQSPPGPLQRPLSPEADPEADPTVDPVGTITYQDIKEISFITSNQTAETINATQWRDRDHQHLIQWSSEYNSTKHELIRGSFMHENLLPSGGFVQTVLEAYRNHHNLALRPDDIWIAILTQFSFYVNANAEELRHHFVKHNGTKKITIGLDSLRDGADLNNQEWLALLNLIYRKTLGMVKEPEWMINDFSTTNNRDKLVSGLVLMSTFQQYFQYHFKFLCGIPKITLLGKVEDWMEVFNRVQYLSRFGEIPRKWADMLSPVVQKMIDAKRGQIDPKFWEDICRIQNRTQCGGTEQDAQILDGWISVFSVFDRNGVWKGAKEQGWKWPRVNFNHVTSGVVTVPIVISANNPRSGRRELKDGTIFAGHMGHQFDGSMTTLKPYDGWAIARNLVPRSSSLSRDYPPEVPTTTGTIPTGARSSWLG